MKSLALLSSYPAQGKTTIAVNLAAGLTKLGYQVILLEAGDPDLLKLWFNISTTHRSKLSSDMGFDMLIIPGLNIKTADFEEYDFIIIDSGGDFKDYLNILNDTDLIAACTDLRGEETAALPLLDNIISSATTDNHPIDLVIPTIINTKEWSNNSEVLFALLDYFGEARVADMVPE